MLSGASPGGGLSPAAEAGLWVDILAKPDSAASLERAARQSKGGVNQSLLQA